MVCSASMKLNWMILEFMIHISLENLLFHEERTEIGCQEQRGYKIYGQYSTEGRGKVPGNNHRKLHLDDLF